MDNAKAHGYTSSFNMVTAILLGKRGCDKALIGNTMLGNECFSPQTSTCKHVVYQEEGQICNIINTPDLYHGPKPDCKEEALPQTGLSYSGERVFLLILQQDNISPEEIDMFEKLKKTYGETIVDNVIVVLDTSNASQQGVDENIERILHECGGRVCYFKRGMKKDELNDQLLQEFKRMLKKNAPDRLESTYAEPRDNTTSENEESQPESAGEKAGAAVPEVKIKNVENRIKNTADESKLKLDADVPGGKNVEGMNIEDMGGSNRNTLAKNVQPKPTGENPAAAAPEEEKTSPVSEDRKTRPSVQESLDRSNKRLHNMLQAKKSQANPPVTGEEAGAAVPEVKMETEHNRIHNIPDESKLKPDAAVPGGKKGQGMKYEGMGKSNHNTLGKKPEVEKVQSKPTVPDEEAGAAAPEVKREMEHNRIYNIHDVSKLKPDADVPERNKAEGIKFKVLGKSNTLGEKPEAKEIQPKPKDKEAGAAAAEVKMTVNNLYETTHDSKNSSYESMDKYSPYGLAKEPGEKKPPAVPTADPPAAVVQYPTATDVLTIVLLGQAGSGKSATGNTILAKRQFESRASSTPVTQRCEVAEGSVCGIKVRVIDTPDFFDEDLDNPKLHIQKCKDLSQVQPVVYLLVMHMGRFTEGEREAVSNMQKTFGEQVVKRTVVLFTGKEKLKDMSLNDYIKNADPQLDQLVQTFGSRIFALNNNEKRSQQVRELMKILVEMPVGDRIREQYSRYKSEQKECRVL